MKAVLILLILLDVAVFVWYKYHIKVMVNRFEYIIVKFAELNPLLLLLMILVFRAAFIVLTMHSTREYAETLYYVGSITFTVIELWGIGGRVYQAKEYMKERGTPVKVYWKYFFAILTIAILGTIFVWLF